MKPRKPPHERREFWRLRRLGISIQIAHWWLHLRRTTFDAQH